MTFVRNAIVGIIPLLSILVSGAEGRDFPLASCKGANGTITEISGVGTNLARMTGVMTTPDAIEYCVRQVSSEKPERCAQKVIQAERGARYFAEANCSKHILKSKTDQRLTALEQFNLICDKEACAWESMRTGEVLGNSCGDGTPPLFRQFEILCPKEAEPLPLSR